LQDSVSTYLCNDYPNFDVIIIDNGSIDNTKEYVEKEFPEAKVIRIGKNRGYSGGFNFGLDYAFNQQKADYVLITNNDVKADAKVISSLVEIAETDKMIGFVTGKVYYFNKPDTLQTIGKNEHPILWNGSHIGGGEIDKEQYEKVMELAFADDIFTLVRKEMYDITGGYDTTFFLQAEEYDWQARAKKFGYKIFYSPRAKIWHKESMTIGKTSALKEYYNARNPMLVILKHKSPEFFRKYFWQHLKKSVLKQSVKEIVKKRDLIKAYKIWQGFFSGMIWGFKNKKFTFRHFF
jgi:GT2 family glycosyltransferase